MQEDPRIHLICHEVNTGVGGAVLDGYEKAVALGADVIVKIDSDGQMDPSLMKTLIKPILQRHADYTKGNRFLHASQLKSMPPLRRL
ncbi:MAG: glycosyltransferase, partial [Chloroflexi bacterium]|nr:glycosyltransferase [Chloroflexota bacterium]